MTQFIKKIYFLTCLTCTFLPAFSQSRKYDYFADRDFNFVKEKMATYGGTASDSSYRLDFYDLKTEHLKEIIHYKDEKREQREGVCLTFFEDGKTEWSGSYKNNEYHNLWLRKDSTGHTTDSVVYEEGKLKFEKDTYYYPNGKLNGYTITDSVNNTLEQKMYTEEGSLRSDVNFIGNIGTAKDYDSSGQVTTTLLSTRTFSEASFTGGAKEFKKYLERNLNANTPVENGAPAGTYIVIVKFIVAKDGTVSEITPETNAGYGMEKEVVRMIRQSPPWEPAVQFGRKVNAYRRQPVTFVVEERRRRRH